MKRDSREIERALRLGHEFQNFVAERFDQTAFTLIHSRVDQKVGGHFPVANHDPDLVWRSKQAPSNAGYFAVECKFRSGWKTNASGARETEWCSPQQRSNYEKFAEIKRMPVFVVLGIGGTAGRPESVYTIPLRDLSACVAEEKKIRRYKSASPFHSFTFESGVGPLRQDGPVRPAAAPFASKPPMVERERAESRLPPPPLPRKIIAPHREPRPVLPDYPPTLPTVVYVETRRPSRRLLPTLSVLLLAVAAMAAWQSFAPNRQPPTAPHPVVVSASVAPTPMTSTAASRPAQQLGQLQRTPGTPNGESSHPLAAASNPVMVSEEPDTLYHYQKPVRAFRLTIEASEPAAEAQLAQAIAVAQVAVARISKTDRPPYLAVETLSSERYPKLRALMLYDMASGQFVGPTVFLSIADIDPGTKLYVGSHEALWVANGSW